MPCQLKGENGPTFLLTNLTVSNAPTNSLLYQTLEKEHLQLMSSFARGSDLLPVPPTGVLQESFVTHSFTYAQLVRHNPVRIIYNGPSPSPEKACVREALSCLYMYLPIVPLERTRTRGRTQNWRCWCGICTQLLSFLARERER